MREISNTLIEDVLRLFQRGWNTADMAKNRPAFSEADYARALRIGLERRRVQRVADFMTGEKV